MSIFDRDFSQIDAAVVAGGSAAMIRNVLQAALDEIAVLRKERSAKHEALKYVRRFVHAKDVDVAFIDDALKLPGEA